MALPRWQLRPLAPPLVWSLLFCGLLASCQMTQTGRSLESRFGSSLARLTHKLSPERILRAGSMRLQKLVQRSKGFDLERRGRTRSLVARAQDNLDLWRRRVLGMPVVATQFGERIARHSLKAMAELTGPESFIQKKLDPGLLLANLRRTVLSAQEKLHLDGYILPGPGDPDRGTDPLQTKRRESWIERLLRRF